MPKDGLKKSVITSTLDVKRKTDYQWSVRMVNGVDWKNSKQEYVLGP